MKIKRIEIACLVLLVFFVATFLTNFSAQGFVANLSPSPTFSQVEATSDSDVVAVNKFIWYQPSNGNVGGGKLDDFGNLFSNPNQWTYSRGRTSVFFLRTNTLDNILVEDPDFIETILVPFLNDNSLDLALDTGGANWASCKTEGQRANTLGDEVDLVSSIEAAGGKVNFIGMQSVLTKPIPEENFPNCVFNLVNREFDIDWYMEGMKSALPNGAVIPAGTRNIKYGIIDSLLAEGETAAQTYFNRSVAQTYNHLVNYQKNQENVMDFILMDHPVENISEVDPTKSSSLSAIRTTRNFFVGEGIKVGIWLVSDSRPDTPTESQFANNILWYIQQLEEENILFSYYVIASWYVVPDTELPETVANPALNFPLTRILKVVSQYVLSSRSPSDVSAPAAPSQLSVQ